MDRVVARPSVLSCERAVVARPASRCRRYVRRGAQIDEPTRLGGRTDGRTAAHRAGGAHLPLDLAYDLCGEVVSSLRHSRWSPSAISESPIRLAWSKTSRGSLQARRSSPA